MKHLSLEEVKKRYLKRVSHEGIYDLYNYVEEIYENTNKQRKISIDLKTLLTQLGDENEKLDHKCAGQ